MASLQIAAVNSAVCGTARCYDLQLRCESGASRHDHFFLRSRWESPGHSTAGVDAHGVIQCRSTLVFNSAWHYGVLPMNSGSVAR
jgi:hypothetical protein